MAGILCQPDSSNKLNQVCYFSRKWTTAESIWQVHDQELGAIVVLFQEWRAWLLGAPQPTLVFSDHHNLCYFMRSVSLSPRQARWAAFLSSFSFNIAHTPGKNNPDDPPSQRRDFYSPFGSNEGPLLVLSSSKLVACSSSVGVLDTNHPSLKQHDPYFVVPSPSELARLLRLSKDFEPNHVDVWRDSQGFLWHNARLFVPLSGRGIIFSAFHTSPMGGHQGLVRTLSSITQTFSWPGLQKELLFYTTTCDSCQRAKVIQQPPAGFLRSIPVSSQPWSIIGMDFIVKLPCSRGCDTILVIVDTFTKGAHFIPCLESMDAPALASLFLDCFVRYHGFPQKMIIDRGFLFISTFWRNVCAKLGTKPTPSTAYHPQTDGQTKQMNQTLEEYLRHFCSYQQENWVDLLPLAELCLNNTSATSTGFSPFFLWQGFHPRVNALLSTSLVPAADKFIRLLFTSQQPPGRISCQSSAIDFTSSKRQAG
ncbi:hypothetical protein O181_118210 [Austropuccinia psidii MF-1]|uniref:Integrase catalytic domain-containing protein n=1 Tax=Austropuccinia psidii MF-1 TaxID=1389203 RepID=A0A9Q3PZ56_9BASI|nr:hypothetical protein [Austropuccinia psidii MF-1]